MTLTRRLMLLAIIAALVVVDVVMTHNALTEPYPGHNDFMSRWEGARSFWVDGLNPYGDIASMNIQERIYGRAAEGDEDPGYFAYPMYMVLLVWPLVYTSYAWASAVWMVLLEVALLGALALLLDLYRWRPKPLTLGLLVLWTLFYYYAVRGLILGQPGVLVYFLQVLALWALFKQRDSLAAVALAISTIKPQMGYLLVPFLLLWALWALRARRWRFVGAFGGVMVALLLVSFALEPRWLFDWVDQLRAYPSYTALGSPVWIVTEYYLNLPSIVTMLVSAGLYALLAWFAYDMLRRRDESRFWWLVMLSVTVTNLVAPRTATPHYVIFSLPLFFYFRYLDQRYPRRGRWRLPVVLLALLIIPWAHFLTTVVGEFEHPSVYLPLPFGMLALLWLTRRQWWQDAPPSPAITEAAAS